MINKDDKITVLAAYTAMFKFLDREYELAKSDDIGGLLGDMSLLESSSTADAGAWEDWLEAVGQALSNDCDIGLRILPKDDNQ